MNDFMMCDSYIRFTANEVQRIHFACIEGLSLIPEVDDVAVIMGNGAREIVLLLLERSDVKAIKEAWEGAFQAHLTMLSAEELDTIVMATNLLRTASVAEALAVVSVTATAGGRDRE